MSAETVVKSLREAFPGCKIIGTNIYPRDWLYVAKNVDVFFQIPRPSDKDYLSTIIDTVCKEVVDFIIPLTDPEVDILSENRREIEKFSVRVALCDDNVIKFCRDKLLLFKHFSKSPKIDVIRTLGVKEVTNFDIQYPIVAKPRNGRSSEGLKYLNSEEEVRLLSEDYIIQEFISGDIITVDIIRDRSGNVVCLPRRELIRTPNGAGISVMLFTDVKVESIVKEVADSLGIIGCMNIEFIQHSNKYYLMDINPRFSAGLGFSRLAGYDFVKNHISVFNDGTIYPIGQLTLGIASRCQFECLLG